MESYTSEKNLPLPLFRAVVDLDGIQEHVSQYTRAEAFGIRFEASRILNELADIERRIYTLAGEVRKAERLTSFPEA